MLTFTVAEWDELPWFQQRLYLEGMAEEMGMSLEPVSEDFEPDDENFATETDPDMPRDLAELASFGVTVRRD